MYDFVIVGGGSAGCVLASRLSEDPHVNVLLLEAGPDFSEADMPKEIFDADYAPYSYDWNYASEPDDLGIKVAIPRGKIIGGSSSVNYCFAMRARPADHSTWAAMGGRGWEFESMLPYYRKMETYALGDPQWHGSDGPYPIVVPESDELSEMAAACAVSAQELGFPMVEDFNDPDDFGFSITPLSTVGGQRISTAIAYLERARTRSNLTVRGEAAVDRVVFEGTTAVGVVLDDGETIHGREIVLCSGAFNSPAIALRSGVGPAADLQELGIEVVADRPGVGKNLTNHPAYWQIFSAKPPVSEEAMFQTALCVAHGEGEEDYDLHILPTAVIPTENVPEVFVPPSTDHPTGWDAVFFVAAMRPRSRGSVRLRSRDPRDAPIIDSPLFADIEDARAIAAGVEIARALAAQSPVADLLLEERSPGAAVTGEELVESIRRSPAHYNHGSCSMSMGRDDDPLSVVDPDGRVHGVSGLRVVDASIFPVIPRVPTNVPTIALAERIASVMLQQR